MSVGNIIVAGDGHFHLYPGFEPERALAELIRNLDGLVESAHGNCKKGRDGRPGRPFSGRTAGPCRWCGKQGGLALPSDQDQEIFRLAFLAESGTNDYFHQIIGKKIGAFAIAAGPESGCLEISRDGKTRLCLAAGRQMVTGEKLEILGLGMEAGIADGLPAVEIIEKITAAGGLPVLPFSPGKWLFKRGETARQLAGRYGKALLIGDSALRPIGWPAPEIMRRAAGGILPGSDPLPLPGEEKHAGCYGFVYQGRFDVSKPLTAIKEIMRNNPGAVVSAGRRRSLLDVLTRVYRLRRNKSRVSACSAALP